MKRVGRELFACYWRRLRSERGQGLVEAAFVLPILLSLSFGVAEMSLYMHDYLAASSCAREAARRAALRADVVPASYCSAAAAVGLGVNPPGYKTAAAGTPVTATVDTPHNWIVIGSLIPGMGTSWQITVSVTMRLEGQGP